MFYYPDGETHIRGNPVGTVNATNNTDWVLNKGTEKVSVEWNAGYCIKNYVYVVDKDVKQKFDECNLTMIR